VALYVLHRAEGPTWPLAEVRTLLQQTERGLKLCRPWLFADSILREQTKNQRQNVAEAAAARPGALQLPAIGTLPLHQLDGKQPSPRLRCVRHSQPQTAAVRRVQGACLLVSIKGLGWVVVGAL